MLDVAKHAGVSQTTVSLVLNNPETPNIPDETRQRVLASVAELGYRPNVLAQGLRMKKSGVFGFITDSIAISPHAGKIFEGAQDIAWENDKILILVNTKTDPIMEASAVDILLGRRVEGIIYATMYHRAVTIPSALRELPMVLLDCFVEDHKIPSVVPDEFGGGYTAVKYLLEKGHRRIGFINSGDDIPASSGRLEGYKFALEEYGVPFDPELVARTEKHTDKGYPCARKLLQIENRPSALFCFNDRAAMGAYDAIRQLNLKIPDDVAVVGFDNQEIVSENLYPSLTTIELPHYQMGVWAVQKLVDILTSNGQVDPIQHKMPCPIIVRDSA
ncbi:MAG: LacI family transcriptional regulator [Anaerolinea sp.]|nr:LacI family transcriptional regulator [Anaerolinea sp.]